MPRGKETRKSVKDQKSGTAQRRRNTSNVNMNKRSNALSRARATAHSTAGPSVPRGFVGAAGDAKFVDTASATYAVNTTGSITHISIIAQGDDVNKRDGKACRATSVQVRGAINADTTNTLSTYQCALVWDYNPNKALPVIGDIFDSISAFSFPKRENNKRFKIVKKFYGAIVGNQTTVTTGLETIPVDEYVRLPADANILYTAADTTGVIGDVIAGALYWVTMGSNVAGTADANAVVGFRVNFTDQLS